MKPLNPESLKVLERYRAADSLGGAARERLLGGIAAQVAAGVGPPSGVGAAPPSLPPPLPAAASAGLGAAAKLGLGVLLASVPAAIYLARHAPGPAHGDAARIEAPAARAHAGDAPPAATNDAARGAAPEVAPTRGATEPDDTSTRVATSAPRAGGAPRAAVKPLAVAPRTSAEVAPERVTLEETEEAPAPAAPSAALIDEEVALLGEAHTALRSGRPKEALVLLGEHARRFPNSKLGESREVARILALCNSGQKAASRAAADRFLAARPGSPLAGRVRAVCADTQDP